MSEVLTTSIQEVLVVSEFSSELLIDTQENYVITSETVTELLEVAEQGVPGPQGEAGQAGTSFLTYPALGPISGHRAVHLTPESTVIYADGGSVGTAFSVLGISMNAAASGDPVNVQFMGEMIEPSWNWEVSRPIFCGVDGVLTQTQPSEGFSLVIGVAISPTKIIVGVKSPIIL